jgi:hypothetical protein
MHTIKNVRLETNNQKILVLKFFFVKDIGLINDAKPKTSRIFDILLPTTFPHAIPGDFSRTALIETTSSGNDVPKAIIEIAINWGFTLNIEATLTEPVTNFSPP